MSGAAVGSGYDTWGSFGPSDGHAALYTGGISCDLNTLIPSESGWELIGAYGINNEGQISGWGYYYGEPRAFRLTPIPEPLSLVFFGTGLAAVGAFVLRKERRRA